MATYKRINQLGQAYSVGDNDFLPVDIQGASETQKVKKSDLFYGYVTDAPNDENTKGWTWARRNGNWYRIYPDDYVFEAPTDGKIYVRVNGEWVSVTGVSGDMLQSIYDTHGKATDIFDYVDNAVGVPDNASESLLGAPIVKTGKFIYKDYGIETDVLDCLVYGETIHRLENPVLVKSFENKSTLSGIDIINLFAIGRDLLTTREIDIGSFGNKEDNTVVRTLKPAKVNKGETYTFKDEWEVFNLKVVSVNRLNEPDGIFSTSLLSHKSKITIPNNVEYVAVELQFTDKREINLEEFNNYWLPGEAVYYDNQYKDFFLEMDTPLYSLDLVASDYCDFNKSLIYHNIKKDTLTYEDGWKVSTVGSGFRNSTVPFELSIGQTSWVDNSLIYGDSNVLTAKSIDDFAVSDTECIAFHDGKVYIRINYDHLQRNSGQTNQEYENGLQGFLYSNPIDVIYKLDSPIVFDVNAPLGRATGEPQRVYTFDSITNFFAVGISEITEEDAIFSQCDLEMRFDNVVNHLVRKRGDVMTGDLTLKGYATLFTHSIQGYPEDETDSSLKLNFNSEDKVYVNGDNPVLDLRDFTTKLDWEPKAQTIPDKEANDKRLVNAEYIHRDYAPLDSAPLVGIPTAPKATELGTSQIATGEFVEENYYNKTEADGNYIHSVDGEASGNLVLNETLPKNVTNKKRIPNVEFIETYYYDSDETDGKFAPIDSPHLTGIPTTPMPDEVTGTQITNVDYVKNNYYSKNGGPIYGDVTVEGTPDKKGDLTVKGNINNAKYGSDGTTVTNKNLAVVTDNVGNIVTTDVTTSEIQSLKNIKGNIQSQIDNIPKYNYLSGLSIDITGAEWPAQSVIDTAAKAKITATYPSPKMWDAVTVAVTLLPSDKRRDLLYYYTDGSLGSAAGWYYLYDLSTSINRANGTTAGIVEDSTNGDVTFADGSPTVHHSETADKLSTARTINGTSFDGSANITTAKWGTARTLNAVGAVSGTVFIDGSSDIDLTLNLNYQQIYKNADLNTYTNLGFFHCLYNTYAATLLNCPTSHAFGMEVISTGAGIRQIISTYSISNPKKYFRNLYTDSVTWSSWYRIFSEADKPTSEDIGVIQLTNEDLNDIKVDLGFYYAAGGNQVINSPFNVANAFGLECNRVAGGFYLQTAKDNYQNKVYQRLYDGSAQTWQPWIKIYNESNRPTPAEIGAISSSGGTYTGWLEGGTNNVGLQWTVDDGTVYRVKAYKPTNNFQITSKTTNGAETSVMNIFGVNTSFGGPVSVSNAPTSDNHVVNKKYVDDVMASAGTGDMLKNVYDTNNNGIVDNAEKVNGLTVLTAVPANAKFTDTTYGVVSTAANGLAPKLPGNTTSYLRGDGVWATIDVPSGAVSGVKGNAESTYRSGNVNLTPANIGAMPLGGSITLTSDLTINCATGSISIVDGELNYDAGTY